MGIAHLHLGHECRRNAHLRRVVCERLSNVVGEREDVHDEGLRASDCSGDDYMSLAIQGDANIKSDVRARRYGFPNAITWFA